MGQLSEFNSRLGRLSKTVRTLIYAAAIRASQTDTVRYTSEMGSGDK